MVFLGAKVVIFWCFLIHLSLTADSIFFQASTSSVNSFILLLQGLTLLCFPVLGLLGDVCFNRYKLIKYPLTSHDGLCCMLSTRIWQLPRKAKAPSSTTPCQCQCSYWSSTSVWMHWSGLRRPPPSGPYQTGYQQLETHLLREQHQLQTIHMAALDTRA